MNKLMLEKDDYLYDTCTEQYIHCPCVVSNCGWGCSSECSDFQKEGNIISCRSTETIFGELVPEESKRVVVHKKEVERIRTFEVMAGYIAGDIESWHQQSLRIAKYIVSEKGQGSIFEMVSMMDHSLNGDVIVRVLSLKEEKIENRE